MAKDDFLKSTFFDNFQMVTPKLEDTEKKEEKKVEEEKKVAAEEVKDDTEEAEEIEDKKVEDKKEPEKEEKVEEAEEYLAPLIKHLAEENILFVDETKEYEDSDEGLAQIISDTVEKKKQEWIEELPEEGKELIEFIKAGGKVKDFVDVNTLYDYSEVDLTVAFNQEELVREHYAALGWEKEDIEEKIADFKELEKLEKEAKKAQQFLVKQNEDIKKDLIKKQEEASKRAEKERLDSIKQIEDTIYKITEVGGKKLTKAEQDKLKDHLFKVGKDGKTAAQRNAENLENRIKLMYLDMKGFKFDDLVTKAETQATRKLKMNLNKFTDKNVKSGGKSVEIDTTEEKPVIRSSFFNNVRNLD